MAYRRKPLEAFVIPEPNSGCWLFIGGWNPSGYGLTGARGSIGGAHREAWRQAHGSIPAGLSVLHKCDTRCCVNPDHLFLGTQKDNMRDMIAKGRWRTGNFRGSRGSKSVFSDDQVAEIRAAHRSGVTARSLANKHSVATSTIYRIVLNQSYVILPPSLGDH